MYQFIALSLVAIAAVYSELGRGGLLFGYILPLVGVLSAYYLLRAIGALIILTGVTAYYFMDMNSPSLFRSLVLPCLLGLPVMAFGVWAWREGSLSNGSSLSDSGGSGLGGDCGGDGGGC